MFLAQRQADPEDLLQSFPQTRPLGLPDYQFREETLAEIAREWLEEHKLPYK
jgi:hypothetical protein